MTAFKGIPIQLEPAPAPDAAVVAGTVIDGIRVLLERLAETGDGGAIDLRALPDLDSVGYRLLKERLAEGEVSARVESAGQSEIRETAYPGVWWITHRNEKHEIITEVIEVTEVPEILKSQRGDIRHGLLRLAKRLSVAGRERPKGHRRAAP